MKLAKFGRHKNKNNIKQMRERLCRLMYLYADGPKVGHLNAPRFAVFSKSMFQQNGFWENIATVEQYFMSWMRSEAKSKAWIARVEEQRQPDLFAALV